VSTAAKGARTQGMETKVHAAGAGAGVTAAGLGFLIAWIVDTFTGVRMPSDVAQVVGAVILGLLAWAGGLVAGWAKGSRTSAVSDEFDPQYLKIPPAGAPRSYDQGSGARDVLPPADKVYYPGDQPGHRLPPTSRDVGMSRIEWLLVICAVCLTLALLFGWDILRVAIAD
jgi:hypothetical protein